MATKKYRPKDDAAKQMAERLGGAIRRFRTHKELTQDDLVRRLPPELGVNQTDISTIEQGEFFPTDDVIKGICAVLGCTPRDVWNEAEAIDELKKKLSGEVIEELIDCLGHEKFQLPYEAVSAIREYFLAGVSVVDGDDVIDDVADLSDFGVDPEIEKLGEIAASPSDQQALEDQVYIVKQKADLHPERVVTRQTVFQLLDMLVATRREMSG